ncbi:hypothetical protein HZH68_004138 [Vespula germanica]|uniref:Uncharacterized protein n=1 Tax=Vespula germanica TaxID=30212 RepID=A0A834NHP8_VESGE|nr:hypothetical protein HZH68_004138 [Vespula germanica]
MGIIRSTFSFISPQDPLRSTSYPGFHRRMKKKNSEVEGSQGKDFVSKKVQASCELKHCESCNIASETILRMINAIRSAFHENKLISAVAEERDLLKGDIYEKTQWAVMRRLAAAIEMDVKTTFEMMQGNDMKREAIKRNYEEKLNSLEAELSRKGTDFELLRGENFQLEGRIENVFTDFISRELVELGGEKEEKEDYDEIGVVAKGNKEILLLAIRVCLWSLKRNFNALKEKNFQMEETKERLTIELKDTRIKLERTAESWDILQSQIVKLAENKLELENSVRGLTEKIVDTRSACLETERALRILLTELQRENDSIKKEYRVKLEKLETELKAEMKYREIEKEPEAVRSEGLYEERVLMPGDDPVLDMTRQLISNRRKIEHLQRQNERLSKTEFGDTIGYAVGVCTHALSQQEGRHVAMCGNINKVSVNPNSMQSYCLEISAIYQAAPVSTSSLKRILLMLRIH